MESEKSTHLLHAGRAWLGILFLLLLPLLGWGQTDPGTFDMSGGASFSFTGFGNGTLTAYPTSMQGHKFAAEPDAATAATLTAAPNGDFALSANSASATTGSIRNEVANGLSILNSSTNNLGAITVALKTTGRTTITLGWLAERILDQASRESGLRLQYRVGTSGTFTDVSGSVYAPAAGVNTAQTFSGVVLPAAADNQAVVQVRWLYYVVSGSSARDRLRLDEISISSSAIVVPAANPTLTTDAATLVTNTTVTLNGSISSFGSPAGSSPAYGFVYSSTATTPTLATGSTSTVATGTAATTGAFSSAVTGLAVSTTYYYQAYATNGTGTSYGGVQSFLTLTPTITATGSLTAFSTTTGTPSASQSFTVSGSNLTAALTVGPLAGYEFSSTGGAPYSPSLSLTPSSGTVATTTVSVRLTAVAAGTFSGNIANASTGATTRNVAASGTVSTPTGANIVVSTNGPLALGTVAPNTAGPIQTYTVSGTILGATPITITAPAGVELSLNGFVTSAATTLSLTPSSGTVATTTISVRLAASASAATISSNITNVSGSASQPVAVTGTVVSGTAACLAEGFEAVAYPPTGWITTGSTRSTAAADINSGSAAAIFGSNTGTLTTGPLSNPSSLTFYLGTTTNTNAKQFQVNVSTTSQTAGFTTLRTYSSNTTGGIVVANSTYNQYTVDLSAYSSAGTVWIQFAKVNSTTTAAFRFDDVAVTCGAAGPAFTLATGTSISGSPFCINQGANPTIAVPYTVSGGSFGTGNVFTAVLSDASGSFASGITSLGTLNAVASGTISGSIPNSVVTGTAYRVRVQASSPATNAPDNGADLVITNYQTNEVPATATATAANGQVTVNFGAPATCATSVIITARLGSAGTLKPLAGNAYTANAAFGGSGSTDLGGGQYVVYNGPLSSSVTVTGLTNGSQYFFQLFTTGGNGYSDGIVRSARPVVPAILTEVLVPQLLSARTGASAHANRLPYVWRATVSSLLPSTTYKYYTAVRASADAANYGGVGIPIEVKTAGAFVIGTTPALNGSSSTFTTDASGSYTGWFAVEPTSDSRFADGSTVYPLIVLNAGDGNNVATQFLPTTSAVTATLLSGGTSQATAVRGNSFGTPSNFIFTYDNTAGTGRPLAGTWVESDGTANTTANNYAAFYSANVEAVAGAWGLLTPNTNVNGIRRVEQRALADGSLVGCPATDADGTWPGGAVTVSPTGGTTALVLTTGDAPFQPATVSTFTPASGVVGSTVTISGTNFTLGALPTVSFNGGTSVPAATVNATGTSLTVVVPAGAASGPLSVTAGCGTAVTTAGSFTVAPSGYYTKPSGDVGLLATYGDQPDGSGIAPTSFTATGQTFTITATTPSRTFASNWTVSGSGSKVVVASGASLVVPATATLTAIVDMAANSTLTVRNTAVSGLMLGSLAAGSTVDYAQTGTFTVPTTPTYANLKLTNGTKTVGDLSAAGSVTFDNVTIAGTLVNSSSVAAGSYPTIQFFGDFNQLAGVTYDATHSISLQLMNLGALQNLNGNGNTIALYRLYTAASGSGTGSGANSAALGGRLTGTGSVLQVANNIDGGLALYESTASLALDAGTTLRFAPGGGGNFFVGTQGLLKPNPGANLEFYRNTTNSYTLGTLRLAAGFTTVNNFLLNSVAAGANTLTLTTDLTVNGTATLQAGTLIIDANTLTLNGSLAVATGGFLNGSTSSNLVIGGSGAFGTLAFASGAQLLNNLTMSRIGGTLTLAAPLTVSGTLALTEGIISTSSTSLLTLTTTAGITGSSAASFINGPLARATASGARTVLFPIGKGTAYRPLTLNTTTQTNTRIYTAEQFNASARTTGLNGTGGGTASAAAPLTRVSNIRYFSLTPDVTTGTYSGTVTLTFDTDDRVNYPGEASFVIAKRSNSSSAWGNFGRTATTSTASPGQYVAGTLTSDTFSSFSDVALASTSTVLGSNSFDMVNPLPVELTRFAAKRQAHDVALDWATASEKNSAYFEIERSLNAETFVAIAKVAGQGSSSNATTYVSLDRNAPATQLYYRLRQVDTDGHVAYSAVVAIVATGQAAELTVYPNPARTTLHFNGTEASNYRVVNMLGQVLLQGHTEANAPTISVAKLSIGTYYLELQTSTGRTVRKFIVAD